MEKKCTKCGEVKSLDEFGKCSKTKSGKRSSCIECERARDRKYSKTAAGKEVNRRKREKAKESGKDKIWAERYRNSPKCREYMKRYNQTEKGRDRIRRHRANRRARLLDAPSDGWKASEIHAEANGRCLYCGTKVTLGEMHADHYIPLSKGGSNLRENIVCSCASCNLKKNDKMPEDFIGETL